MNLRNKLFLFLFLALPSSALAAPEDDLQAIYGLVQNWYVYFLLPLGTVLAGIVIIIGGIMYASSGGDSSKTGRAKELIFGAIIGLALLIGAALIIRTLVA